MKRQDFSIIIANALDHFDTALYGFMAPLMAPLFFPHQEPIMQLILAHSFLATSSFTRPVGAIIFGWLASYYDPYRILRITLMGVGVSTLLMGFLPTFETAGYFGAAGLLALGIFNGIFASGEKTIASLAILERKTNKHAIITNAWFESSAMWGMIGASWMASVISPHAWRVPFWCGGLLALYAIILRLSSVKGLVHIQTKEQGSLPWQSVLAVIFSMGLSYVTYDLCFIFMNSYVPLITDITRQTMMEWNTILLIIDLFLLIGVGYVACHHNARSIQNLSALMLAIPAIPLFYFMEGATLAYVLFVRSWIALWGVVFSCVLNVRLLSLFPYRHKYLWIGLWSTVGIALIGRSTSALCLWGWHETHLAAIPGIYLCLIASLVLISSWSSGMARKSMPS